MISSEHDESTLSTKIGSPGAEKMWLASISRRG